MTEALNITEIFCSDDGDIWYGMKQNWRNKRNFAKEVKNLTDSYDARPLSKLLAHTETVQLAWCDCGPGCEFNESHVLEADAGLPGYRIDLEKADRL